MFRTATKVTAPLLYAVCLVPTLMGVIASLIFIETVWGFNRFNTLYANGDLGGGLSALVIGGLIFIPLILGVLRLENTARPGIFDHLRHCAFLYAVCVFLFPILVSGYRASMISAVPDPSIRISSEYDLGLRPIPVVRRCCHALYDVELGYRTERSGHALET